MRSTSSGCRVAGGWAFTSRTYRTMCARAARWIKEALSRGNSVYLADRVIPMLPERLSNGVCSLKPRVDRLTFSAFIDFTAAGKIKHVRFSRSVIRSKARLTYKQAFAILSGKPVDPVPDLVPDKTDVIAPEVIEQLHTAWELASLLRKNRFQAGSLDLDFPEVKVWLDKEGHPVKLEKVENDASHQLVEEFMLAANEVVAREIKNRLLPCIYRVHDDPDPDRLEGIPRAGAELRPAIRRSHQPVRGPAAAGENPRVCRRNTRSSSGSSRASNGRRTRSSRAGITGSRRRTTRTLPAPSGATRTWSFIASWQRLRRTRIRAWRADARPRRNCPPSAEHISATERVAADAEKESVKLKKMEYLQGQLRSRAPQEFEAVIIDVKSFGLIVELPSVLLTGMIHVSAFRMIFTSSIPSGCSSWAGASGRPTAPAGSCASPWIASTRTSSKSISSQCHDAGNCPRLPRQLRI
jgi:ribonuclease R